MRKKRISNIFEISSLTPSTKHFPKSVPSTAYWTDLFIEQGQRHNLLSKQQAVQGYKHYWGWMGPLTVPVAFRGH